MRVRLGVTSLNQTVGDWAGNRKRILSAWRAARADDISLLLCPELSISGYSLGDRLPRPGTLQQSYESLKQIAAEVEEGVLIVGLPVAHRGVLYNAAAVLARGALQGLCPKGSLATGDVEYENRWYQGWEAGRVEEWTAPDGDQVPIGDLVFEAPDLPPFAFEICEELWRGTRPGARRALAGAEILLNPSASWFTMGKHRIRRQMVREASRADLCAYLYASLSGCDSTRLVFDGAALIAAEGRLLAEGDRFLFDQDWSLRAGPVDLSGLRRARLETGSWRAEQAALLRGERGPAPQILLLPEVGLNTARSAYDRPPIGPSQGPSWLRASTDHDRRDPSLDWLLHAGLIKRASEPEEIGFLELELALCLGLRDYLRKARISALALALSGGRDSAMVAILVDRMFTYQKPEVSREARRAYTKAHFLTAYLATENSGRATREAAREVAEEIASTHHDLSIQATLDAHQQVVEGAVGSALSWEDPVENLALQNVQARLRGVLIWSLANLKQALLLVTSNQSEAAVGYTTMDGDTSGGLALIAGVPKSLVNRWLSWAEHFHGYQSLSSINALAPSAELKPPEEEQTDEAELMPFPLLDRILYHFIELAQDPLEIFISLWPEAAAGSLPVAAEPTALRDAIARFIRLFCFAQWKRERFAIAFRIHDFDLDPKAGGRFPPIQAPFTEELAALDLYLERERESLKRGQKQ
ncbi:MAG: NAD(+) synthase [Myxococcota bacterium]|nr:NAD(+) synthase [Myxococcota bacterium]